MDDVAIPEPMAWKLYQPYVQRRLVKSGINSARALRLIQDKDTLARKHLDAEMKERPVIYSRAPAWHKFNVIAGYPRIADGDNIRISPFVTDGMNADFDGDTMAVHAPARAETVQEAKDRLLPSKMLFTIRDRDAVMPQPKQEQLLGLYVTQTETAGKTHQFGSQEEALKAIKAGEVNMSDDLEF